MNLDNWQRREMGATATNGDQILNRYYGYTNVPNAADTDAVFSIRKISVSGGVETAKWNDNAFANFNAKWSERAANFNAPTGTLGFTYSGTNPIIFSWNRLSGANQYDIIVRNSRGDLVSKDGGFLIYNNDYTITERYYNTTSHTQRITQPDTYQIVLSANNAAGSITATHSYTL